MSYSIDYFKEAKIDVREAKTWYKEQKLGLEKRFADSIKLAILKIKENPLNYAIRYKDIRIAYPKIFPYGIHFYIDELKNQILIVAILHNKRNADTAQKRV
ncbi:MAG: type II toxin-antitoxin system RelE/ParE family toxin [Cytophagales bacterium]